MGNSDIIPLVDEQLAGNPRYDPSARSYRSRLFLVSLEFQSGEYGVPFYHTLRARNADTATRRAERYLDTFYSPKRESRPERRENTWYYYDGEVSVKLHGVDEVDSEEVVRRLLMR